VRAPATSGRRGLGAAYRQLWTAAAVSTLGDGVLETALPLLAAELTRDPLLVSAVALASWLPWLLFGLLSGALVDRWERRRVMWVVDGLRFLAAGLFGVAVLAGWASIGLLVAVGFLLGVGQTFFDNATQSAIPALVSRDRERLQRANGQLYAAQTVGQRLAGPPAGGALFALAAWLPFVADAVSFACSAALIGAIGGRFGPERAAARSSLRAEIAEGLRWLFGQRLLRHLAVMVGLTNVAFMAGDSILVLFAQERLGLGSVGFGLLLTALAAGGLAGSLVAARLGRLAGAGTVIVAGNLVAAATQLTIGLSSSALLVGAMLALVGASTTVFNVVAVSLRQLLVPDQLIGRVVSAFRLFGFGAIPLGAALGGLLGRTLGLRAPFLFGGLLMAAVTVYAVRVAGNRAVRAATGAAVA
jgi:MFS family permease